MTKNTLTVRISREIDAPQKAIYRVIADYREGHAAILPRPPFTAMVVTEGGTGAGTRLKTTMRVMGRDYTFDQIVTEPEPGRVIVETDVNTGESSRFILTPTASGTNVTIESTFNVPSGLAGLFKRAFHPAIVRRIFSQELDNLAAYLAETSPHSPAETPQPTR